jgi:hypothetical protein
MGLTPEGWIAAGAAVVGSIVVGWVIYTKVLKPKEEPEFTNNSKPPVLYNGIYERTSLCGTRRNRQRTNKSRRK